MGDGTPADCEVAGFGEVGFGGKRGDEGVGAVGEEAVVGVYVGD